MSMTLGHLLHILDVAWDWLFWTFVSGLGVFVCCLIREWRQNASSRKKQ